MLCYNTLATVRTLLPPLFEHAPLTSGFYLDLKFLGLNMQILKYTAKFSSEGLHQLLFAPAGPHERHFCTSV